MTANLFEPDWEERGYLLGTTPYDQELGIEVARDAWRVTAGQLSEVEFHQKYHRFYLKEFGVDLRPSGLGGETVGGGKMSGKPTPESDGNRYISRRTFIKLAAGAGVVLITSTYLGRLMPGIATDDTQAAGSDKQSWHTRSEQIGMVIDLERCTGCLACIDGCHRENNLSPGVHWIYVIAYEDENQDAINFLVRLCQHCSNPPCVKVCPTLARHKREKDGLVLTDYKICIGCRYCQIACPYGANYFEWGEPRPEEGYRYSRTDYRGRRVNGNPPRGVMGKCTFCPQRQDNEQKRGTKSCQLACPHDVIYSGDINDPWSPPRRYLEKRKQEKGGRTSTFRLLEELGTEPNIIYIGHQPSRKAKQVTGPTSYKDWGFVDERRVVLEGPRPWFMKVFGGR